MLREYEVQESISSGVARVLRGEVNAAMMQRGAGQRKGVRFDVAPSDARAVKRERRRHHPPKVVRPGFCAGCDDALNENGEINFLPTVFQPLILTTHVPYQTKKSSSVSPARISSTCLACSSTKKRIPSCRKYYRPSNRAKTKKVGAMIGVWGRKLTMPHC